MSRCEFEYSLRLYDDELMVFSLCRENLGEQKAKIISINEDYRHLLPLDLTVTDDGILKWLKGRVIPKNRFGARAILGQFSLSPNDVKGMIDVSRGLSLNDCFWAPEKEFRGSFAEHNLFENAFSEAAARIAFCGCGEPDRSFSRSPELTTNGVLPKAWRRAADGVIRLYKSGSRSPFHTGYEPYSEYYACQLAHQMGINAVKYDLDMWMGQIASKCALFTNLDTAFVPIGRLVRRANLKECLDYYDTIGQETLEQFKDMLVFDAVICNEDRHFGNFGILRNNRSGKVLGAAPIFDNGQSLFFDAKPEELADLGRYAKSCWNPYRIPYEEICQEIMGDRQREKLRRLLGFTFARHPKRNLPEDRLAAVEVQIQHQVNKLLGLESEPQSGENDEEYVPSFLRESVERMQQSWATLDAGGKDHNWDIWWCELNADINFAEANGTISSRQANWLRKTFLRM